MNDLRQLVLNLIDNGSAEHDRSENARLIQRLYKEYDQPQENPPQIIMQSPEKHNAEPVQEPEEIHDTLSLEKQEIEYIRRALQKHDGKRKDAALELGISERTLYRKIKEHNLE
jgi:transcriptional regulator with PAS, ATPase and Fis domain